MPPRLVKFMPILLTAFSLIATFALIWFFLENGENPEKVDLHGPAIPTQATNHPPLRFAIAPVLSPERTVEDYLTLTSYIASQVNRPIQLVQRKTYMEINELLRHRNVQVAIICTGAYLHARISNIPLEVIAVATYPEGPVYYSLIVVDAESGIESFQDLRGRSFAFSDPLSLSGHYYPLYFLIEQGLDPHKYFCQTTFTYSHDGNLRAILDKTVVGAAVDSLVYEFEVRRNPMLKKKLRVIHRSPPLGINPVVILSSFDPALREALQKTFLEMKNSPEGKKILNNLRIVSFDLPAPDLYNYVGGVVAKVKNYLEKRP